jgi:CHAT domain-containing protein
MAIVSYFCGRDTTTCFVVDADSPGLRAYRIPLGSARLTEAARLLRQAFDGDPAAFPPRPPIHPRRPHRRDLTFLDELGAELLPFASRPFPLLCVVPHGPLHLLPLHALPDATGTPLAARCAVTYAPSLSLLAYGMEQAPRAGRRILVAAVAGREDPEPAAFERDGDYLRAAGAHISELTGTAATRPALLAALAGHDVAHVTCHGYTDPHNPMESGLVVADEDGRPTKFVDRLSIRKRRRSVLRAEDIADARVALRLVTLRACASGQVAAQHAGDEFTGLARSLLRAGAASTVTALWNVDQESSGRLHELMYRHWLGGEPLWRALWLAQRSLMDDATRPAWNHRYHWAPLVLIGDWR